eukprot:NODE_864_length_1807_cov_35.898214_g808_i0.p1 GENE.NODE_864_length_1807_cov_35.898214_g808_i0~~NODE_864_length_1807_cov_35.898214_g808_i0.p1  ORF type:complete len:528 (-),score=124.15 NODE_864_length_1807_cov_35.898214_g808_i0:101-1684(-)
MELMHVIAAFPADVVRKHAALLVDRIKASTPGLTPRERCYLPLAQKLAASPPAASEGLRLLNAVWQDVSALRDLKEYMLIASAWLVFVAKNFKVREINILLNDICDHFSADPTNETVAPFLPEVLSILLTNVTDLQTLFSMEKFLPLIDLLQTSEKVDLCKRIMSTVAETTPLADPLFIQSLLDVARTLHDSMNEFSIADERRQYSHLITAFLRNVDYGKDLDAQLNFYVECRRSFSKMEVVQEACVAAVIRLIVRATQTTVIKQHSKKNAAFVKACLAFCHITIPSLHNPLKKLRLLLLATMVSLCAGFITQGDMLLHTCITLLSEASVPSQNIAHSTETELFDFVSTLLSALVVIPSTQSPLHALLEVHNYLDTHTHHQFDRCLRARLAMCQLQALATLAQPSLPYHFQSGTLSNDELYATSVDHKEEIHSHCSALLELVLTTISELEEKSDAASHKQSVALGVELLNVMLKVALPEEKLPVIASKVYAVITKRGAGEYRAFLDNTLATLKTTPQWSGFSHLFTA